MADNLEQDGTSQQHRYYRKAEIDEQVRELMQEPLSYIEERAQVRYGHSEYVYSETLVELFFHWRNVGRSRDVAQILETILERTKHPIYGWCQVLSVPDPEELYQVVITELMETLYHGDLNKCYFWCCNFYTALRRLFIKCFRKYIRYYNQVVQSLDVSISEDDDDEETVADTIPAPQIGVERCALSNIRVDELLGHLTPQEIYVAHLRYCGYDQDEIAQILGCTDRTVRNINRRIQQKLIDAGLQVENDELRE
jgi:RNA polymerase sigma factor (sigma-70 family)